VYQGSQVTIGEVTAHGNVEVANTNSLLHVLGDYMQTGGDFRVFAAGNFDVDGTFAKMGCDRHFKNVAPGTRIM
jgi:hypothetical protein